MLSACYVRVGVPKNRNCREYQNPNRSAARPRVKGGSLISKLMLPACLLSPKTTGIPRISMPERSAQGT
jgi:hypothetical protein